MENFVHMEKATMWSRQLKVNDIHQLQSTTGQITTGSRKLGGPWNKLVLALEWAIEMTANKTEGYLT